MPRAKKLLVETAPGELIDKITILEIKTERMADAAKVHNVRIELAALTRARERALPPPAAVPELPGLTAQLKRVNQALWDIEDHIRHCERNKDFGPAFIKLARSVYRRNDRRAKLKRKINTLLGSTLIEEKSYTKY
jgi:hypothetical protein